MKEPVMKIEFSPRELEAFLRYYGGHGNQDFQKARLAMIGEAIDHLDWEASENYRNAQRLAPRQGAPPARGALEERENLK